MKVDDRTDTLPWYRQFWPWFIIALPSVVVVASIITIVIAVSSQDRLVKQDEHQKFGPVLMEKQVEGAD